MRDRRKHNMEKWKYMEDYDTTCERQNDGPSPRVPTVVADMHSKYIIV